MVFFPGFGEVKLDLGPHSGDFELDWLDISDASWKLSGSVSGGKLIEISPPVRTGSVAVIIKK